MSVLSTIGTIASDIGSISSLANTASALLSGDYARVLSGLGGWASGMQVASWRGVPFAVQESVIRKGRRVAQHVYPFRDTIWVEDLGRGVRRYTFRGFLVGDNVLQQSERMQEQVEAAGPGVLVHPALGSRTCMCPDASFRQTVRGRVIEVEFDFVETTPVLFPAILDATQNILQTAVSSLFSAIGVDFQTDIVGPLAVGADVAKTVSSTVSGWASIATTLVGDASMIARSVSGLSGNYGRYSGGSLASPAPSTASVASLLSASTTTRTAVSTAAITAAKIPTGVGVSQEAANIAANVAALSEAVRTAAQSPADQVRLLSELADYFPAGVSSSAAIGTALSDASTAAAALCRRSAMASLGAACSGYLPSSSNDAMTLLGSVTDLFDAEIIVAADAGDLTTWQSFRAMRSALVSDLTKRAAQLPAQRQITTRTPMPSLTLAYRLYEDATRSDDLIARAAPIHPAFMPTTFEALAS